MNYLKSVHFLKDYRPDFWSLIMNNNNNINNNNNNNNSN